jgi:hypothetical protein
MLRAIGVAAIGAVPFRLVVNVAKLKHLGIFDTAFRGGSQSEGLFALR